MCYVLVVCTWLHCWLLLGRDSWHMLGPEARPVDQNQCSRLSESDHIFREILTMNLQLSFWVSFPNGHGNGQGWPKLTQSQRGGSVLSWDSVLFWTTYCAWGLTDCTQGFFLFFNHKLQLNHQTVFKMSQLTAGLEEHIHRPLRWPNTSTPSQSGL